MEYSESDLPRQTNVPSMPIYSELSAHFKSWSEVSSQHPLQDILGRTLSLRHHPRLSTLEDQTIQL